jgi:hypothetical protein
MKVKTSSLLPGTSSLDSELTPEDELAILLEGMSSIVRVEEQVSRVGCLIG